MSASTPLQESGECAIAVYYQDDFAENLHSSNSQSLAVPSIPWDSYFPCWLEKLSPDLPPADGCELSLRLTDDAEIAHFNARYRNQDRPTDVLAFAALEADPLPAAVLACEPLYLGDILISVETADRQAQQQNHSLRTELVWLAAHGFLHLLGWDHPDEGRLQEMLSAQSELLSLVGLQVG